MTHGEVKSEFAEIGKEDVIVNPTSSEQFPEGSYMELHFKSIWPSNILEEINYATFVLAAQKKWVLVMQLLSI